MKRLGIITSLFAVACVLASISRPAFGQGAGATFGDVIGLGGTPSDLVLDELRGRIYLINDRANRVDLYSVSDKRVIGSIPVGNRPLSAAMSMDSNFLFVTNQLSSSLSVIDLGAAQVVQTVSLPARPEGVEVGVDGRALIATAGTGSGNPPQNTLLVFDRTQQSAQQLFPVQAPPPASTPAGLPALVLTRPDTNFFSKLIRTPDGRLIIGLTNPGAQTYMFVYEVASGVILRSRTVGGQSTVLSMAPDGSRFMAGFTMYDSATLAVIGQQSAANAPFTLSGSFNVRQNLGGSIFSPDGATMYSAFNVAQFQIPALRPVSSTLLVSDGTNLGIRLGIKLPESIIAKFVATSDGQDAWALSESGMIHLPVGGLYEYPILQPETTTVFLASDECNRGLARTSVKINNLGKGRLTFSLPNTGTAVVAEATSGVAPSEIRFTMEPGRTNVIRQAGTNLATGGATLTGNAFNVNLASTDAINIPNTIRIYMNFRNPDQRGVIYPLPTTPNSSANGQTFPSGNEGLQDLLLDEPRGRLYVTNSGYNRIEVFDLKKRRFLEPIPVGQMPHQMALSTDGVTLYVGNTGGESISIVDLELRRVVGGVEFPSLPRQGGGANANPAHPRTLAMGLFGLQFVLSNGTQWKVVGNVATVRPPSSVTQQANGTNVLPGGPNFTMLTAPNNEWIVTLDGSGRGYLYDAKADAYVAGRLLFSNPIQGYYGSLAASKDGQYFLANGLILNSSLTAIGGAERPGVPVFGPPPAPGQPPTVTIVSSGQRNVASVVSLNDSQFVRLTTAVRANVNVATRDDARPTLELVDVQTGGETLVGVLAENPALSVFGTQRWNVTPRQMVVESSGNIYAITLSGITVTPAAPASDDTKPVIAARGIVNSNDGTQNIRPGTFITITGRNLADFGAADTTPPPALLGGSCVTFNDIALPLLQSSNGQILAQVPETVSAGLNVVQVRSLAMAQASDPLILTVQRPGTVSAPTDDTGN